jgi:hypothetical protein
MVARERLLVLDLLESYALERRATVGIERREGEGWRCQLQQPAGGTLICGRGHSAREAIRNALQQAGVELPD